MINEILIKEICNLYKNGKSIKKISKILHIGPIKIKEALIQGKIDIHNPNNSYPQSHKPNGYWNNYKICENAAMKCRNRREFYKLFPAGAKISKSKGWINDFDQYFSIEKQFYSYNDKIHMIYAYEITEKHAVYIGRTMNIKRRDSAHRYYNDTLNKFCKENNLEIPIPIILENELNALESQEKEDFWINKYKKNNWNVLNKAKTGRGSGSLGSNIRIWTYERCKEVAKNCVNKQDYRHKYPTACRVSIQNHWINEFFENMHVSPKFFDNFENCLNACKKYSKMSDVKKGYPFLYHKICQYKWNDDIANALGWRTYRKKKED